MLIQRAINVSVPNKDYGELFLLAAIMLVSIVASSVCLPRARSRYMIVVGQEIIYDIRKDLFEHLQKLPFQFYDDRASRQDSDPCDQLCQLCFGCSCPTASSTLFWRYFNLMLIAVLYVLACDVRLSLIVMAGIPLFLIVIVFLIKPAQRRAWQDVSNKGSNLNAYLHESLDGA